MTIAEYKKISLPEAPGVYFFRDASDTILYIGKATSLKDRVRSYFASDIQKTRGLKIVSMVLSATHITWQETPSVLEAILLETELIKKYKPVFNTKDKDDKSYNCVVITKETFPRVLVLRTRNVLEDMKKDIAYTFGPFYSGQALRDSLKIIRKIFPFRDTCNPFSGKPCFNAQIGLCPGVCMGTCTAEDYKKIVRNIVSFFKGNREEILRRLHLEMAKEARALHFERAGEIKKTIFALTHIRDSALIKHTVQEFSALKPVRIEGFDVAHISGTARVGVMVVIENGEPYKAGYRKFKLPEKVNDDYAALSEIISRRLTHTEWPLPDMFVIDGGRGHMNVALDTLRQYQVTIPVVCVVKNATHKPDHFLGDQKNIDLYKKEILLTNSESHRFAVSYHTHLRNKNLLNIKDRKRKVNKK